MVRHFFARILFFSLGISGPLFSQNGTIDLSYQDFTRNRVISLDGKWLFQFEKYITPQETDSIKDSIHVPASWNYLTNKGSGFATYSLKVELPEKKPQLALKLMSISSAYHLFVNGKLVKTVGLPGKSELEHKPGYLPSVVVLPETGKTLHLVFHVANYMHHRGGIWRSVKIGNVNAIQRDFYGKLVSEVFLAGALIVFALYFLIIYFLRRSNKVTLWFSFVAIMMLIRVLVTEEMLLTQMLTDFPFNLQITIEYLNIVLIPTGIMLYIAALYPQDSLHKMNAFWYVVFCMLLLFIAFFPVKIFTKFLIFIQLVVVFASLFMIASFSRALYYGRAGARAILLSGMTLLAAFIHDSLYSQGVFQSVYLTPFGFLFFIFSQAIILANIYEQGMRNSEKQATELEIQVEQRTKQLKEEKENALEAAETKMAFMAAMSHDIRTPLNSIIGMTQLLQDEETPAQRTEYLRRLHFSTDHLLALINEILEFNDLEKGNIYIERDKVDLQQLLADIAVTFREQAARKNLHFSFNNDSRLPRYIYTDKIKLLRILLCLLDNAVKFTSHGYVSFRTELHEITEDTAHVLLEVSDTGAGISERKMNELFKSFIRDDSQEHIAQRGAGLGLAISIKLANILGGEIRAHSEKYKGSVFTVYLPLTLLSGETQPQATTPAGSVPEAVEIGGLKILVVDDNDENRLLARHLLRKKSIQVFEADSGLKGLKILENEKIDLVLLDMLMPDMDGPAVCKKIRGLNTISSTLPIIALTASASAKVLADAREAGITDILLKPYKAEALFEMIATYVQKK